jgi:hypothetical protein
MRLSRKYLEKFQLATIVIWLTSTFICCKQKYKETAAGDSTFHTGVYSADSALAFVVDSIEAKEISGALTKPDGQIMVENSLFQHEAGEEIVAAAKEEKITSFRAIRGKEVESTSRLPRRIQCRVEDRVIRGESAINVYLSFLDSAETETTAHKDFLISIEIYYLKQKETYRDSILFKRKEYSVKYMLPIKHEGPLKVIFNNKELMGSELLLKSIDQKKQTGWLQPSSTPVFQFASLQQAAPIVLVIPPTSIFYKANGKQEAPITYSLEDPENRWSESDTAKINVVAPAGLLSSNSVVINRSSLGVISLKSLRPGIIMVRSIAVTPGLKIDPVEVPITFVKDIDSFEVLMPDSLHLLEEGELVVNLKSTGGSNITTDQDIPYSVATEGSALRLEPKNGVIEKGKSNARLKVIPVSIGSSKVTISIENYLDQSSTAKVKFPTFLIFLALIGGALGGFLSLFMNKEKNYWKIVVSAITGPMLMWLSLYMGIGSLSPTIILNPISCFLIAFIGGWAGVAVISSMLRGFGFTTPPQVANGNNGNN